MPHTSKKAKKTATSNSSKRLTYVVVAVIIAIVVGAVGFYGYTAFKSTTTSTTAVSTSCPTSECAVLDTSQGTMEAELFPSVAPKTVANFVNLANSGFYDNLVWHRIVAGFVIQTGDPTTRNGNGNPANWVSGGSSTTVPLETNATVRAEGYTNNQWYLGMARGTALNSGTSQFYVNLVDNSASLVNYTVFGKLINGMSVAQKIGSLAVYSACVSSGGGQCWPLNVSQAMLISVTIVTNSTS